MIKEKLNDLGIQGSITLAGALREKNEYNISMIYTTLTWLDFDRFELRADTKTCRGRSSESSSTSSSPESPRSLNIPLDSDVGGREASELDHRGWLRSDLVVVISMSLSFSNNKAALFAAWGS